MIISLQDVIGEEGNPGSLTSEKFGSEEEHRILSRLYRTRHMSRSMRGHLKAKLKVGVSSLVDTVIKLVAEAWGLSQESLLLRSQDSSMAFARSVAAYLIRKDLGRTCFEAAEDLGFKGVSYLSGACKRVKIILESNDVFRSQVEAVRQKYLPLIAKFKAQ